jgi:hypothetical protein
MSAMPLENFEKLTRAELKQKLNELFAAMKTRNNVLRPSLLLEAQFYMQELDRRHDSWISLRDLILELVIIALIGWEVHEGNRQFDLLGAMNRNTAATVAAMNNLRQDQQASLATQKTTLETITAMNEGIQRQLGVNYEVNPEIIFLEDQKQLRVVNKGRDSLFLWGSKWRTSAVIMEKEGKFIPIGGNYFVPADSIFREIDALPKGLQVNIPFEVYLAGADGRHYTVHLNVAVNWETGSRKVFTQALRIKREKWPRPDQTDE